MARSDDGGSSNGARQTAMAHGGRPRHMAATAKLGDEQRQRWRAAGGERQAATATTDDDATADGNSWRQWQMRTSGCDGDG